MPNVVNCRSERRRCDSPLGLRWDDLNFIASTIAKAARPRGIQTPLKRKLDFATDTAGFVSADGWMWFTRASGHASMDALIETATLDGGWASPEERANVFEFLCDEKNLEPIASAIRAAISERRSEAFFRQELISEDAWQTLGPAWERLGIGGFLIAVFPRAEGGFSSLVFFRRAHRDDFTASHRAIIELLFEKVDWIHFDSPEHSQWRLERASSLRPRQREVLEWLLAGDTNKIIAIKMKISPHTVGDHVKDIYKFFQVSSRGELLAQFISPSGG